MTRTYESNQCPICVGKLEPGKTVYTLDLGDGLLVVKQVPARICDQCGEQWIDDRTAEHLERLVGATRQRKTELEVLVF